MNSEIVPVVLQIISTAFIGAMTFIVRDMKTDLREMRKDLHDHITDHTIHNFK